MTGARRTAYTGAVEPFGGIRFGMQREQAIELLRAHMRPLAGEVAVEVHEDGLGGGSTYLEGGAWTGAFSHDVYEAVYFHVVLWRKRPAGREASVAQVAASVEQFGPPRCVALLVPTEVAPVEVNLEWAAAAGQFSVRVSVDRGGEWDVREELSAHPLSREGLVSMQEHGEALARLADRLGRRGERDGWTGEFLGRTEAWVRGRAEVLERLAPLLPGVGVCDLTGSVAEAERVLDVVAGGLPDCDGVFVVIAASDPQAEEVSSRVSRQAFVAGLRVVHLTWRPGFDCEPTTREPMPPPPPEQIEFVEGPLAARLLTDEWLPARCEVLPASFVTVEGAVEEWLRVPPAADAPRSRKYEFSTRRMWPLRLSDPASGRSVHVNMGGSREELLRYAHALLAARRSV